MGHRKLRLYGDADLDGVVEDYLRAHKWVNYVGARELGYATRGDDHHYQEAAGRRRALVTHDDGYLAPRYRVQQTAGIIVIRRGRNRSDVATAFNRFLLWWWAPALGQERPNLGNMKVELSVDGFHYWMYTEDGQDEEDYWTYAI